MLSASYPMVAQTYARKRSVLAKEIGLGARCNAALGGRRRASWQPCRHAATELYWHVRISATPMDTVLTTIIAGYALASLTTFIWMLVRAALGDFQEDP